MSRTKRNKWFSDNDRDDKSLIVFTFGHKMKAYTKNNKRGKFGGINSRNKPCKTIQSKIRKNNANIALKKQARNQAKQEIINELNV